MAHPAWPSCGPRPDNGARRRELAQQASLLTADKLAAMFVSHDAAGRVVRGVEHVPMMCYASPAAKQRATFFGMVIQ